MKKSTVVLLVLLFVAINATVYFITYKNANERIDMVLKSDLKTLQTHYEILLETQKNTALATYVSTIGIKRVLEILTLAQKVDKKERDKLRAELIGLLTPIYTAAKIKGVLQYQFVFKDNISFLRMHKPSKFGDDLTDIRDDFRYVSERKKPIRGFVQGRVAHGFRNTFPLFDKDKNYIGAMEVSFSSERFQWFLNEISHICTHFLVNKRVFDVKFWQRDDKSMPYIQSAESKNYMISLGSIHSKEICVDENMDKFKSIREVLNDKIKKGNKFTLFVQHQDHEDIVSFLPIKNLDNTITVAWIVSYSENRFIRLTLQNVFRIRVVTFIFSLILIYFITQLIISKMKLREKNTKLKDIAHYDPLTGLRNRLYLESDINSVIQNYFEHHAPYAVLMFDIDWFKEVNDTYGHDVGDRVLKELSTILRSSVRKEDKIYRAGGEEFVILLNRIDLTNTTILAEKIRFLVQEHTFYVSDQEFSKTISCGLFHSSIVSVRDVKTVLKLVDNALYKSKKNGRNMVTNVASY